jgi:hypothetical protein
MLEEADGKELTQSKLKNQGSLRFIKVHYSSAARSKCLPLPKRGGSQYENTKLKRLVADLSLHKVMRQDVPSNKF